MSLTSTQQAAVAARGNVLVVAGAGTGKTSTLVERCLNCLLVEQPRVSLDEILMVTFTEAAAADMRRRIRQRLEQELEESTKHQHPSSLLPQKQFGGQAREAPNLNHQHLREQLALFETAHIGTLHSFCFQLVRQHFYELGLDPQMTVLAEEEARLLAQETLDEMFQKHYAGGTSAAAAVQELIEVQGEGRDQAIRALVLRLHHYTQTRPDPAGWLVKELAGFAAPRPEAWERWLGEALVEWQESALALLQRFATENEVARNCLAALQSLKFEGAPLTDSQRPKVEAALQAVQDARENCPRGKKKAWVEPLEEFFEEEAFFASLVVSGAGVSPATSDMGPATTKGEVAEGAGGTPAPLAEDWNWVRGHMTTLLELAREFETKFSDAKRELGVVDFHDLEQHALRLMWDARTNQPTATALHWRKQFRLVFVDEYQDINAAQDKIIEALSRAQPHANRFLVGDVKQSIYRFRLADPSIFQNYARLWARPEAPPGQVIPLVENFRSREGLLEFVNSLFGTIMRPEVGGVDYNDQAQLRFGAPEQRQFLSAAGDPEPRVELCLRLKGGATGPPGEGEAAEPTQLADLEEADKEARAVALRLRELKAQQHSIWDAEAKRFRPVEWSDIAILLRSPASKSERYAKAFARLNVPLQVARGGFYESLEISDLLSLMQALDNPLQDLPLLAVLRSPLVGLTLDELAMVRLAAKGPFWLALGEKAKGQSLKAKVLSPESKVPSPEDSGPRTQDPGLRTQDSGLAAKISQFLDRFTRWRRLARQASLSRCLEAVLTETYYGSWWRSQPGGEQHHANIQRLLALAREFDQFQRQGLFRFLRFVEAQQEADSEPGTAPVSEENAVRLMSIHQSKGLEFPVVVVADLGKAFNVSDLRADVILDEKLGLCPQITAPRTGARYPSLPHWLASRRQHREMLGEELRLLYVAMTRARDTLLLSASVTASRLQKVWQGEADTTEAALTTARSFADWLGMWFARNCGAADLEPGATGQNALLRWAIHDDAKLIEPAEDLRAPSAEPGGSIEPEAWRELQQRLMWPYPFTAATAQAAKIRVSDFARRAAERPDEDAVDVLGGGEAGRREKAEGRRENEKGKRQTADGRKKTAAAHSAAEIGSIHHVFLELVSLEKVSGAEELRAEAGRLEQLGVLSPDQTAELDFDGMAAFWTSTLGEEIRSHAPNIRRELAFTVRFSPAELAALTGTRPSPGLESELIVAEGKADLLVIMPDEIRLVDFKTDRVPKSELPARAKLYSPQLSLYARALSEIYRRPVTERWLYFLHPREAVRV